jgi:hypothetical protein
MFAKGRPNAQKPQEESVQYPEYALTWRYSRIFANFLLISPHFCLPVLTLAHLRAQSYAFANKLAQMIRKVAHFIRVFPPEIRRCEKPQPKFWRFVQTHRREFSRRSPHLIRQIFRRIPAFSIDPCQQIP